MTRIGKYGICLALSYLWICVGFSQTGIVRGVVTDSLTGKRLPYSNIVVLNSSVGASANNLGFYLIPSVPIGEQEVAASIVGYERKIIRVIVPPGRAVECNFELAETIISSAEILVSGESKREISQISTSIHLLDAQDIKIAPVALQEDVFQAFRILPGIVSTSDVGSKFYVRGGAGDQNLFLLDGMKIYTPFHALGLFSVFDPDIIRNAEVYTGAFPPGLGGRLSSVVSLSSRDGRADRVSLRASANFLLGKFLAEGPGPFRTSWIFNGRKSVSSRAIKRVLRQDFPVSFYDGFFKISSPATETYKYDLAFLSSGDDLLSGNSRDPDYHWKTDAVAFTGSGLIAEKVFVEAVIYGNKSFTERNPQLDSEMTPSSTSVSEFGLRGSATLYTGVKDFFFFGFEFGFPTLEYKLTNNLGLPLDLKSTVTQSAVWMRYQANLDPWMFDGGIHAEVGTFLRRAIPGTVLQPRINVSYLLFGNWRAKASYGTFSQDVMTVSNEDDVISIFEGWIEVPSNLPPQQADHYILGVDGNVTEKVSVGLQSYFKHYRSLATYNRSKVDAYDPDYVRGKGKSYGLEAVGRMSLGIFDIYASYALSWTKVTNVGVTYYPRYDRRHHMNVLGVMIPTDWLSVTVRWEGGSGFPFTQSLGYYERLTLVGSLPGPFEYEMGQAYNILGERNAARLPDYHRLDLAFVVRFIFGGLKGTLGLQIINIYDQKNIFYFDRRTGQKVNMVSFFPSANLSVEY